MIMILKLHILLSCLLEMHIRSPFNEIKKIEKLYFNFKMVKNRKELVKLRKH